MNKYRKLRKSTGLSMQKFGNKYGIPLRTVQSWEGDEKKPPEWVFELLKFKVEYDLREFRKGID